MRVLKIDVTKINKEYLFQAKAKEDGTPGAKYLDCVLNEYKDGVNDRGEAGFISQSVSAELRAKGVKGPIIGNFKDINVGGSKATPPPAARPAPSAPARRPAPPQNDFSDDSTPF